LVYLINSWKEKNKFYYTELHILQGTEENKKKFVKDLKKEKSIKKLEQKDNYIFTLNEEPLEKQYYTPVFDPKIIHVRPVAQRSDGYEDWEIASWDRDALMKITEVPVFEVEIKSIKETKLSDIFFPHIFPKLSPKQKYAIELAVKNNYYGYPRRIDLEKLAKIAKVKRQTFQENLRRAEKKLIPFLTESLN
ncbi:MAG: helix-turn-helix domain-containing protein, partial [Nanoarchaeota archaeon]